MQPLLDGPRGALTEGTVRSLLQSHRTIQITYGADALGDDFGVVADISGYVSGDSSITSSVVSTIQRTCSLNIDSDVTDTGWSYLSGYVKPYMVFTDPENGDSARFNLGVYTLTTPQRTLGSSPGTLAFAGYDLVYLLKQPIGDSYEVPAGAEPAQAAADAIGLAIPGVEVLVEDSGSLLSGQLSWVFDPEQPTTYLDVVQTLLAAIGYRPVWVDWEGRFRIEPFVDLQGETAEWVFNLADGDNIVSDERKQDVDLFNVPNWWRFIMADLKDTPIEGVSMFTWEDASPVNPGSTLNRGRTVKAIYSVPATSYSDLVNFGQRTIAATLEPAESFTVQTQPFPLAWHYDVIEYLDTALAGTLPTDAGGRRRVVSTDWRLPLDGMSDMEWTWRTITDQTAALQVTETTE